MKKTYRSDFAVNDRRTRLLPKILLGQTGVGLIIAALALSIIAYSGGYRYDFSHFKLVKTGILVIEVTPKDAVVSVNSKVLPKKSSYAVNLVPGTYTVNIAKPNFVVWDKTVRVEKESVNVFDNIILFNSKVEISELTDTKKIGLLNQPTATLAASNRGDLYANGSEIWNSTGLVTRLSTPVKNLIWYSDYKHVVYQQSNEIRVIDESANSDTLLVTLQSDTPAKFIISEHGTELDFVDSGLYYFAKIR